MTHRQEFKELSKLEPPSSSRMSREGTCVLVYWPGGSRGSRCLGGMSSVWALVRNVRTPSQCCTLRPGGLPSSLWMQREEVANTMRKNTDARARGGAVHSSEETLVMRGERRDGVVRSSSVANPQSGDELRDLDETLCNCETRGVGGVSASKGQPGRCRRRRGNYRDVGADPVEEFVQAVESDVVGFVFPAAGEAGRNSESKGRHEKAGHPYCVGSDCANRGQANHRAEAGSDVPCGFVWISARQVGQTGDSRHTETVLAIRLGG